MENVDVKSIVAIVGRPNVGKSTLFNRIIRKREAIVDDVSGITRDRKTADAEWEGISFTLMDTGGFVPRTSDEIESGVTQQVIFAIQESDLILFLVDSTVGITDVDGEVARLLRKSGKLSILAVNKVDNQNQESNAAEFIRLGLGDPVSISALGGRGIGDLLSLVVSQLNRVKVKKKKEPDCVKLAVVGKPNVGKSTFVNVIAGEERVLVMETPGTTRDPIDVGIRYRTHDFLLIDTAGMRRRSKIKDNVEYYSNLRAHRVIERCDVASVFTDGAEGLSKQDFRLLHEVEEAKKGVLLVVNKWDLVQSSRQAQQEWTHDFYRRMAGMTYIPILFVSCKTGLRVKKVLESAWTIFSERKKRIVSSLLNQLIEDLSRRFQPPAIKGKRVRILYGTQAGFNPPQFVFFSNYPHLVSENYRRFLMNQIREHFGFVGVPLTLVFKKK
ncbi:ribosome biogenesis GTPase Der [bacterium]|nr:ribosome biogenesis GTPase Der [bacterium]